MIQDALESILAETLAQLEEATKTRESLAFYTEIEHDQGRPIVITGVALAEGDWHGVRYTADEIKKAANSLKNLKLMVEHSKTFEFSGEPVGKVTHVEWDDMLHALKFKAVVTNAEARELVRRGHLKSVSVQTYVDKVPTDSLPIAKNLMFVELSLVSEPACETCNIFHWESLSKNKEDNNMENLAVWSTAYINDLPDSSFAYIEPGGSKDSEGKTTPRKLRHLPYKDKDGKIDEVHLRNALARLPQTNISSSAKASARRKLCAAVESWNRTHTKKIRSSVCGTESNSLDALKDMSEEELRAVIDTVVLKIMETLKGGTDEPLRIVCEFCTEGTEPLWFLSMDEYEEHLKTQHPEEYIKMLKQGKFQVTGPTDDRVSEPSEPGNPTLSSEPEGLSSTTDSDTSDTEVNQLSQTDGITGDGDPTQPTEPSEPTEPTEPTQEPVSEPSEPAEPTVTAEPAPSEPVKEDRVVERVIERVIYVPQTAAPAAPLPTVPVTGTQTTVQEPAPTEPSTPAEPAVSEPAPAEPSEPAKSVDPYEATKDLSIGELIHILYSRKEELPEAD